MAQRRHRKLLLWHGKQLDDVVLIFVGPRGCRSNSCHLYRQARSRPIQLPVNPTTLRDESSTQLRKLLLATLEFLTLGFQHLSLLQGLEAAYKCLHSQDAAPDRMGLVSREPAARVPLDDDDRFTPCVC